MKPWIRRLIHLVLPCLSSFLATPVKARPLWAEASSLCSRAIAAANPGSGIPHGILNAIALVESGRRNPDTALQEPWPWSYNVDGESHFSDSKAAAIAEVSALLAQGRRSIDVGCMQINLLHHPTAFSDLHQAFDPEANLRYAIRFLTSLHESTGSWDQAVARYHSATPERGAAYRQRVASAGGRTMSPPRVVARSILPPGLNPAEQRALQQQISARDEFALARAGAVSDPAAALRALADRRIYRNLSEEQRSGFIRMARFQMQMQQLRMRTMRQSAGLR
jgi:hypothetical protein